MSVRSSIRPVTTKVFLEKIFATFNAVPGTILVDGAEVSLFIAGPNPIPPGAVLADFTIPTFTGYVIAGFATPVGPLTLPSGDGQGVSLSVNFICTADMSPGDVILGYCVSGNPVAQLYLAEIFDDPVTIVNDGDFLTLNIMMPLGYVTEV